MYTLAHEYRGRHLLVFFEQIGKIDRFPVWISQDDPFRTPLLQFRFVMVNANECAGNQFRYNLYKVGLQLVSENQ